MAINRNFQVKNGISVGVGGTILISSGNSIGVGKTNPTRAFDVNGTIVSTDIDVGLGSAASPSFSFVGDTNTGIYSPGADQLSVSTTGTQRLTVDASGNLGLGVVPSAWYGAGWMDYPSNGFVGNSGSFSANSLIVGLNAYYGSGAWRYKTSSLAAQRFGLENGKFAWYTTPSGTAGDPISFTQVMMLDASGDLGIGTASPGARLHVYRSGTEGEIARFTGAGTDGDARGLRIETTTASSLLGAGVIYRANSDGGTHIFANTNSELLRIDFSGNVGIGTSSPSSRLSVNGYITENPGDGTYWNVVTQKDIGIAANQIPLNQYLGTMAFQDANAINVGQVQVSAGTTSSPGILLSTGNAIGLNTGIYSPGVDQIAFIEGGIEVVRINASSNVGIGTTNPSTKFEVYGSGTFRPAATQDAIVIAGRAGGTGSSSITIIPATLNANRTITLPDATTTMVGTDVTQTLTNKTLTSPIVNGGVYGSGSTTTDADVTVDSSTTTLYAYVQSASTTTRSINISNLTSGRVIELYLRNTNAGTKTINILASTTTSGFAAVNLSKGDAGGTSQTSVTLAGTSGTAVVIVFNANGTIGGSIS